jgi:hypothetical protein
MVPTGTAGECVGNPGVELSSTGEGEEEGASLALLAEGV